MNDIDSKEFQIYYNEEDNISESTYRLFLNKTLPLFNVAQH